MRLPFRPGLAAAGLLLAVACHAADNPADNPAENAAAEAANKATGGAVSTAASVTAPFAAAVPVEADTLDACRGGFVTPSGLAVTLGIERIVSVDGQVLARSVLQFGELGRLVQSAPGPRQLYAGQDGGAGLSIRMGPAPADGMFIQNSLDNRLIGSTTIIQASVDARGALQAMQFQSTLADALHSGVGGR